MANLSNSLKNLIIGVVGVLLIYAIFFGIKSCNQGNQVSVLKQQSDLSKAHADTVRIETVDGKMVASRDALAAENDVLDADLKAKEAELYAIKKKYNALTATQVKFTTPIDTAVAVEANPDTTDDVRRAHIVDPFYTADVAAGRDSIKLSVAPIDKISLSIDDNYRVHVQFQNPKAKVEEIGSFYVKPAPQKSKTWKFIAGFAAGAIGAGLLLK